LNTRKWLAVVILGLFGLTGSAAFADKDKHEKDHEGDHDNGHWRSRDRHRDYDDDDDRRGYGFASHDRDEFRAWYTENYRHLPPGFARRDRLSPELERELVIRARFPRDLETRVYIVPVELERRLPPPPPDCERVAVGGHIVLRNRNTKIVLDIFHFE
jgi:hypothetical protein